MAKTNSIAKGIANFFPEVIASITLVSMICSMGAGSAFGTFASAALLALAVAAADFEKYDSKEGGAQ